MNILYISKIDGRPWVGPTYSVPKQIAGQAKYDNVFWYNLCEKGELEGIDNLTRWRSLEYYADLQTYPTGSFRSLPEPFSHPELIVVEQGYPFAKDSIRKEIQESGIPYIVIPRGELTDSAQSKKRIKKALGNLILGYPAFMRKAVAIHCLTEQEKKETSDKWNETKIVLPNGTDIPDKYKRERNDHGINCVSIGRIEPYQKGLDLLIDACATLKQQLMTAGVQITLYGSDMEHKLDALKQTVNERGLSDFVSFKPAVFGEEKAEVLRNCDVFLMPSRFEGHPTGLLEALAYGLPCVATTGSNMRKEIEDADAGWTADNSAESIKDALLAMIDSKERFEEKGRNARKLAEKYDWNAIANKTHDEYLKLLNE